MSEVLDLLNESNTRIPLEGSWVKDLESMAMPIERPSFGMSWLKQKHGEYSTKRIIPECYEAMAEAMKTGPPYQTILDPPPADPVVAHEPGGRQA